MSKKTKTDNGHLDQKLALRRYFFQKYHSAAAPHVFDCCQGSQVIWSQLKSEFTLASYWGVDIKPKKGRLKIDSARVLDQPGWNFDLIDVDTYGSPWKHYAAIQQHATKAVTVFLTIGQGFSNFAFTGLAEIQAIFGKSVIRKGNHWVTPQGNVIGPYFIGRTLHLATARLLLDIQSPTLAIAEAVEAVSDSQTARYLGVRLELRKSPSAK